MKIIAKLAKEAFDSGKALGFKANITDATGWLKNHSKGVGEQIGNALSGKAKTVNDTLLKRDMYDKLFAHLDDVAKQYPDATVQIAAKNAKKGGYKIATVNIKNGDETIGKYAMSITNDGTFKVKAKHMGSELSESVTAQEIRATVSSKAGTMRTSYNIPEKTGRLELKHAGEDVAVANYVNKGGNVTRGGATYEAADGLVSGQIYHNGHEVSFLGDTKGLQQFGKSIKAEYAEEKKKLEPLTIALLRPLRDRFNTAIDLFKYNGRKDFERFLSKDELTKSIKELQDETVKIKKAFPKAEKVPLEKIKYLEQIESDMKQAKILITV